jgi:hypothetical protein
MRQRERDTEILPVVEQTMPDATPEEKLQATFELWEFFDAIWAIADRIVTERECAAIRDRSAETDRLESTSNI